MGTVSGDGNERSRTGGSRSIDPRLAEQERLERENEASAEEASRLRLMGAMHRRWIQRKKGKEGGQGSAAIPQSTGRPLADDVRARMEPRLGADLSSVRLHTSGESNVAADQFGARAFTVGSDVHFGAGEFAPGTKEGDRLLAHELTHVVQGQQAGIQRKAQDEHDSDHGHEDEVSQPHEPAEKEADSVADHVTDSLHGDGAGSHGEAAGSHGAAHGDKGGAAPKQQAPAIGAKLGRKISRKPPKSAGATAAPAKGPAPPAPGGKPKVDLATACDKNPIAKQKYVDVMSETQPNAIAKRPKFLQEVSEQLEKNPDPLQAMRTVVRGGAYFFLGAEIPEKEIENAFGISRVVDLPTIHGYYLDPSVKNLYPDPDDFVGAAAKGKFDPVKDIDDRKLLKGSGGVKETWWFAAADATGVDLDKLRKDLYIEEYPNYAKGAVRLNLDRKEVVNAGMTLHKPTAFDGLMQGSDKDPMWKAAPGNKWGLTKSPNPIREGVMKSMQLRFYKERHLMMPTAVPPTAAKPGKKKP